jgi:hypothetical protein
MRNMRGPPVPDSWLKSSKLEFSTIDYILLPSRSKPRSIALMSQRNPRTTVTSAPICTVITHLTTCSVDLHNLKPYDLNTIIALIRI